ncbi:GyrI-like domain-containing protein [Cellulophaga sp. L1A9]|uniref:GyrI-like domain-containing protein n=1 Tax=Cellulophaga sp. L1A9 TaxID=2686362 RepID=UPI00131BEBE9|nr:GyrI-like domain-containing protein [Cellulophaga sp. L1A9]
MKKFLFALLIVGLCFLGWYLFLKPYDYLASFKVKTYPGVVNQSIKTWSNAIGNSKILESKGINNIIQEIDFKDIRYRYDWDIQPITDTTSSVKVYVTDLNNSFKNRLQILFLDTFFEKDVKNRLVHFNDNLKDHLANFKVVVIGQEKLKSSYVVYLPVETTQLKKAKGMMGVYPYLDNLMASSGIESNGFPFLEITYWNQKSDSIHYNFCYPIIKKDNLPTDNDVKYKEFEGGNMIKAIYNGNYITSDRAWYILLEYATKEKIEVVSKPIEIFYSNPNFGGEALEWKAEVFLPLK